MREYIWMDGMPVAVVQGGVVYYIRVDHIGRPVFATDSAANIVWEVNYLPFGGIESSSGSNIDLRFPGQWFQLESGLHQNWMRDYDPTTGRYMQADPLGLVDGASIYGYARQNPLIFTDPTGECPWCVAGAYAAAGAAVGYLLAKLAGYVEDNNCNCDPLWSSPGLSGVAGASAADGTFMKVPKRFTTPGSSPGSSIQSSVLSKLFPKRMPFGVYTPNPRRWPWPKTPVVGRMLGRWFPVAGYGMIGYDAYRIARCLAK